MTAESSLSPILQQALEGLRDTLNAGFRAKIAVGTKLDPATYFEHICARIGPIIDAVHAVLPERTRITTADLCAVSLDLMAAGHFGDEVRSPSLLRLWECVLPKLARNLARDPKRIAGCLSNASIMIDQLVAARSAPRWLELVELAGEIAEGGEQLLVVGKVAAWIVGLAQYRESALKLAHVLPPNVIAQLFSLERVPDSDQRVRLLSVLEANPWTNLGNLSHANHGTMTEVAVCGAFAGLGGVFLAPPQVALIDGRLYISDQNHVWRLCADSFGWATARCDLQPSVLHRAVRLSSAPSIDSKGMIHWGRQALYRPDLTQASSQAFDGHTFAVTIPSSFHVYLFAIPESWQETS